MKLLGKLLLALNLFALPTLAHSDTTSAQDRQTVQTIIEKQISAFQAEDSNSAFQFAAPNIKQVFPNADIFMEMVKRGYQPVYNPKQYRFGKTHHDNARIAQSVFIEDSNGVAYEAVYELRKQEDGEWLISGVYLQKLPQTGA